MIQQCLEPNQTQYQFNNYLATQFRMSELSPHEIRENFLLGKVLGHGEFGMVQACKLKNHPHTQYAYKLSSFSSSASNEEMLMEINLLSKLNHPSIARLYHYTFYTKQMKFRKSFQVGIVIDKGLMSLQDYIKQQEMSETYLSAAELEGVIIEFIHMMTYMHSHNIVHRDIKPANIVVTSTQPLQFKLIDFGLGAEIDTQVSKGLFVGTYIYASPEMRMNWNLNISGISNAQEVNYFKNDVYGLGQTLLDLASSMCKMGTGMATRQMERVGQIYGKDSYIYLIIDAMLEVFDEPRPRAIQLYEKTQWYFGNVRERELSTCAGSWERQEEKIDGDEDGIKVIIKRDYDQNQNQSQKIVFDQNEQYQPPTQSTIFRQNVKPEVFDTDISLLPSTPHLKVTSPYKLSPLPTLKKVVFPPCAIFRQPPTIVQLNPPIFSQLNTSYNFGTQPTCFKAYKDLTFFGTKYGYLGVIFQNQHYLFSKKQNEELYQPADEITCIQVHEDTIWTSSISSKIFIWKIQSIVDLCMYCESYFPRWHCYTESNLPPKIYTDICEAGPEVGCIQRGISTFFVDGYNLFIGYCSGEIEIRVDDVVYHIFPGHDEVVTLLKVQGCCLYAVYSDGKLKQFDLETKTEMKVYSSFNCDERVLDIKFVEDGIEAYTTTGMIKLDYNFQVKRAKEFDLRSETIEITCMDDENKERLYLTSNGRIFLNDCIVDVDGEFMWENVVLAGFNEKVIMIANVDGNIQFVQKKEYGIKVIVEKDEDEDEDDVKTKRRERKSGVIQLQ